MTSDVLRPRVVCGLLLTDERRAAQPPAEAEQTGEELEVAIDDLIGKVPHDAIRGGRQLDSD